MARTLRGKEQSLSATKIIQEALDAGITDQDIIFSRIRNQMPFLQNAEIQAVMAGAGIYHDGLINPALTTLGNNQRSYGFTRC